MPVAAKHQQAPLDFGTATAAETTSAILAYLTTQGFAVWRQNTTGIYDPKTNRWRVNPQSRPGTPDIIGFRHSDAVFIGIEVKAGRDRLRPAQKQFLDELKAAGGLAFIARSFATFVQSFELRGLHHRAPHP